MYLSVAVSTCTLCLISKLFHPISSHRLSNPDHQLFRTPTYSDLHLIKLSRFLPHKHYYLVPLCPVHNATWSPIANTPTPDFMTHHFELKPDCQLPSLLVHWSYRHVLPLQCITNTEVYAAKFARKTKSAIKITFKQNCGTH